MNCSLGVSELQEFPIIMTLYVVVSVFSYSPIPFLSFIYFYHPFTYYVISQFILLLLLYHLFLPLYPSFYFLLILVTILLLSVPLKQTFNMFSFLVTSTDVLYSALNEYSLIYLEENCTHTNISPSFNQHG